LLVAAFQVARLRPLSNTIESLFQDIFDLLATIPKVAQSQPE
jgi:hypothetical protein